jgi:hypothetical protein
MSDCRRRERAIVNINEPVIISKLLFIQTLDLSDISAALTAQNYTRSAPCSLTAYNYNLTTYNALVAPRAASTNIFISHRRRNLSDLIAQQ